MKKQAIIKLVSGILALMLLASCAPKDAGSVSSVITKDENQATISSGASKEDISSLPIIEDKESSVSKKPEKDKKPSQKDNSSVVSKNESSEYIDESDIDNNPDLHSLGPQVHGIDINSKIPYITIRWQNSNENPVRVVHKYTLERFENGQWVDVTKKNKHRHVEELILKVETEKYWSLEKEYLLEEFDLSKEAKYRFVMDFGRIRYYEFTIVNRPKINNISYEIVRYDINGSLDEKKIFEENSEKRNDELIPPVVRIETRYELLKFADQIEPYCHFDCFTREGLYNFNALLKKCDDSFFKTKILFLMYRVNGSVVGVEKENSTLDINIRRNVDEGNYESPTVLTTIVTALSIDKNTAESINKVDGTIVSAKVGDILRFK